MSRNLFIICNDHWRYQKKNILWINLPTEITLAHGDAGKPAALLLSKSSDLFGPTCAALLKNIVINVPNMFVHENPVLSWIWFVWMSSSISSSATFFRAFDFSANLRSSSAYCGDGTKSLFDFCWWGTDGGRYWAAIWFDDTYKQYCVKLLYFFKWTN